MKKRIIIFISFILLFLTFFAQRHNIRPLVAATSSWIISGSNIYTGVSGKVGIGTSSPGTKLEVAGTTDASGSTNTGLLEIGNSLRFDSNEIITNTNKALYLQQDNNGDLIVDAGSLTVDASTNRIGIGTTAPGVKLDIVGTTDATGSTNSGLLELGGTLRLDGNEIITNTYSTLYMQSGNNGNLAIDNTTFYVSGSNNMVGVNTTTPRVPLTVVGAGVTPTTNYSSDALIMLQGSATTGIALYGGSTTTSYISFGDSTESKGRIDVMNNGSIMNFWTNSAIDGYQTRMYLAYGGAYFYETVLPAETESEELGSSVREWDALYVGDDQGVNFGLDQDVTFAYDETTDNRMELTGTNAELYVEDALSFGSDRNTLSNDGTGMKTLTPTTSYMEIIAGYTGAQGDHDDDFTVTETSARRGDILTIVNSDSVESIIINESLNVVNLSDATLTLGPGDTISLMYVYMDSDSGIWVQTSTANN